MAHWDHLEALLEALYQLEIGQEENVWRSLPFFSATLTLEVAALGQALPLDPLPRPPWSWLFALAGGCLLLLVAAVLLQLHRSIRHRQLAYIADAASLVDYLRRLEAQAAGAGGAPGSAIEARLRATLVDQYAAAIDNNRRINEARAQARTRAAMLLLLSIVATSAVVGATIAYQMTVGPR